MLNLRYNYNFCDISLIPRYISSIKSRDDIKIEVDFAGIKLTNPILGSPMKDVCHGEMALQLYKLGGLGIIHRFMRIEEQITEHTKCSEDFKQRPCGCAIGINGDYLERFEELNKRGCKIFCIDVANGANTEVVKVVDQLVKKDPSISIIVGNVASKECFEWLQDYPQICGIRVGIATGRGCSTKDATGICSGQVTSILECAKIKKPGVALIADGGIKSPSDYCKALALGADVVMLGSLIAHTKESPAEIINQNGHLYKVYNGSASFNIQKEYRITPKYIEGKTVMLDYDGETIENLVNRLNDGLRSSMSYMGARTLEEYRANINFNINV